MKLSLRQLVAEMWQLTPAEVTASLKQKQKKDDEELNERFTCDMAPALFKFDDIKNNPIWDQFPAEREYGSIYMAPLQRYRRLFISTDKSAETLMQVRAFAVLIIEVAQETHGKISEDDGISWQTVTEFEQKYQAIVSASRQELQRFSAVEGSTLGFDDNDLPFMDYLY